jgi:hypothetical protein
MKPKLSPPLISTLSQFSKQKETSAYQVCNLLKETSFACEYKNVHERVQKLLTLKLIKKLNKPFAEHGAVYYTLTSYGIETLIICDRRDGADYYINKLAKNYGSDQLFKTFAYQFFERTTLAQISNETILYYLREYFFQCVVALWDIRANISNKSYLPFSILENLLQLIFSITQMYLKKGETNSELTRDHDLELLINDAKFSLTLDKFKERMIQAFDLLMKYSHSGTEK